MQSENTVDIIYQEALALHQQQQFEAAEPKYQEYLRLQSDRAEAWLNLGILYYQTGLAQNAHAAILKSLDLDAKATGYYVLGACLEKLDNEAEAIAAYQEAIALDPNLVDAYNNLGVLLANNGQITAAETVYRQAISVNPSHWGSYMNLGNLLVEQSQVERAIEVYQNALQINPQNLDLLHNLEIARNLLLASANQLYERGKYEDAIAQYQKVLETGTADATVYFYLSESFKSLNREQEAINTLQQGIRLDPKAGQLHFALSTILQTSGRIQEAIESTERASQLLSDNYTFKILKNLMLPLVYETEEQIYYYRQQFAQGLQNLIQQTSLTTPESKSNALTGIVCATTFYLGHQGLNILDLQRQWGDLIHQIMAANYSQWIQPLSMPQLAPKNKIRIGYISSYFYAYSGTLWLGGWLRHWNKEQFEIYCYYTGEYTDTFTQEC
jgi:protein O-GlcNAc transferase